MGVWQPELVTYILLIPMSVCLCSYELVFTRILCKIYCVLVSCMICIVSDDQKVCH